MGADLAVFIIRPEARHSESHIIHTLVAAGMKIIDRKHIFLSVEQAQTHYVATTAGNIDQNYFDAYVKYMSTAGSSIVLLLSRFNIFDELKTIIGPKNIAEARDFAPISLRAKFAASSLLCAVEATETIESTEEDIRAFFPDRLRANLPSSEQSQILLEQSLYPVLTKGLTMLAKVKPANPSAWLGNWLIDNNPNRPRIFETFKL